MGEAGIEDCGVGQEALLKVKLEGKRVDELAAHVADLGLRRALHDSSHDLVEFIIVNGLVVHSICGAYDGVGDAMADLGGDAFDGAFLGPDDSLELLNSG